MIRSLVIRADADSRIGWGHAARMVALAQAWQARGGQVIWCTRGVPELLAELAGDGVTWRDPALIRYVAQQAAWVVLDGYEFDDEYEREIASAGCALVVMDDHGHAAHDNADFIIRSAHSEIDDLLLSAPNAEVLAGPKFALMRQEVVQHPPWSTRVLEDPAQMVVTCGGADSQNATAWVVKSLRQLDVARRPALTVVVGGAYFHRATLEAALASWNGPWRIVENCRDLARIMTNSRLVVSAGGGTMLESLCLGCPTLTISTADNQHPGCLQLAAQGALEYAGPWRGLTPDRFSQIVQQLLAHPERLAELSRLGRIAVDGNGAGRVARRLEFGRIALRSATLHDGAPLFELRNDPLVVQTSLSGNGVTWDEHQQWLRGVLEDSRRSLMIAHSPQGQMLGQVRLDRDPANGEATISISLVPDARGLGLAPSIIRRAVTQATGEFPLRRLIARIKSDNLASRAAFERVGFRAAEQGQSGELIYIWEDAGDNGVSYPIRQSSNMLPSMPSHTKSV